MAIVPLFGSGTLGKSSNVTAQRRINLYAEVSPDADKTPVAYYSRPGLVNWITANSGSVPEYGGPLRGFSASSPFTTNGAWTLRGAQGVRRFSSTVQGRTLDNTPNYLSTSGFVDFADEKSVDGTTFYDSDTDAVAFGAPVLIAAQPRSICVIAQRYVITDDAESAGRFRWSPVGWADLATNGDWNALDYATAESSQDALVAVRECRGDLVLFGVATTEFWRPVATTAVFQRVGGSGIQWGLAAQASVASWNDGLIFLGRNTLGNQQVCMMAGYQVKVVSTPDVEFDISNDPTPNAATGYAFSLAGHSWYVLNLQNKTWAYDITTNRWDEWQTDGGKFAGKFGVAAWGKFLVSDYRDGRIYYLDDETYTDGGQPMIREITSRHVFTDLDRFSVPSLTMDVESGTGIDSGQGSDPQMMMQVSKDGGHTFGNELWQSIGAKGKYLTRLVWRRIGMARDMVFRFRVSDPVKVVIINAGLDIDK